jgi:very-short-patch-repair endonuclease
MDVSEPFRGSTAVAAGLVTAKELRGPRFRRLVADIHVRADVDVDLALLSRAAYRLVEGRGVLGGYSAAELLGASCAPRGTPAEVVVPGGRQKAQPGLRVRRGVLLPDEVTVVDGIAITTPLRTAYDLARRAPLTEAVVAVDALGHVFGFDPQEVTTFGYRHLGARGSAQLPEVVRLANPLAESPMESRIRLAIEFDGLVVPVLQHPVGPYRLDMAYPRIRLGVEYDGREHLTPQRALRDLDRQAWLSRAGWHILRFRAYDVLRRPWHVASGVRGRLILAARDSGIPLAAFDPR